MSDTIKSQQQKILADTLEKTLRYYEAFAGNPPAAEENAFADHQKACKAALGHLDQLVRLGRLLERDDGKTDENARRLDKMLAEAHAELSTREET